MGIRTWNDKEYERGRYAESPKDMPWKGWKDILTRVRKDIKLNRLSLVSAAMAYYALFALVPAITSLILIYAWISDPNEIVQHINKASTFIPSEAQGVLKSQLTNLASKGSGSLGIGAIGTLLFSLWSASKGSSAIMVALNIIYNEYDERSFIKRTSLSIGLTFLGVIFAIIALGVVVGVPAIFAFLNLGDQFEIIITLSSWVVLLALFSFYLSFVYRYGPDRRKAKWKWVSLGAIIAAVLWAIVSALFSWYASEFGNFNKTYGSLGAIIAVMTWFFITSFVILVGGQINAELEHQTKKDSTRGEPKPMGKRDAKMADTLGESYGT